MPRETRRDVARTYAISVEDGPRQIDAHLPARRRIGPERAPQVRVEELLVHVDDVWNRVAGPYALYIRPLKTQHVDRFVSVHTPVEFERICTISFCE